MDSQKKSPADTTPHRRAVALILARLTSSRLPGKGLRDLCGRPVLGHIVDRLKTVHGLDDILLATTDRPEDEPLIAFAQSEGIDAFAYDGHVDDVVGRIVAAGENARADIVILISGDCPLADPRLVERFIETLRNHPEADAVTVDQSERPTIHEGIVANTLEAWHRIDRASTESRFREHPGSVLSTGKPQLHTITITEAPLYHALKHRISVDTPADLAFIRAIYDRLYQPGSIVDLAEVIRLLQREPEIMTLNAHVHQKEVGESSRTILFRLDAGPTVGIGHLRRCQAIAQVLQEHFACGIYVAGELDAAAREQLAALGIRTTSLPAGPGDPVLLAQQARSLGAERIVVDIPTPLPGGWSRALHEATGVPTIVLDNLGEGARDADVLIIPTAHFHPPAVWLGRADLHYGAEWVVINSAFRPERRRSPGREVVVTMGGSDPQDLTALAVEAFGGLQNATLTVITGPSYTRTERVEEWLRQLPDARHLHAPKDVADVVAGARLAVCSFGMTAYELARLGVPALMLSRPGQEADANRFALLGTAVHLGLGPHLAPEHLRRATEELLSDPQRLEEMGQIGPALFDGRGAERVAEQILAR